MAMFVHFAPVSELASIKRHGLRARRKSRGVYACLRRPTSTPPTNGCASCAAAMAMPR